MQTFIWDSVVLRHSFSAAGASQLASDVYHICGVVDSAISVQAPAQGEARRTIKKLNEGLTLLSLKIKPQNGPDESQDVQHDEPKELGLWEVERKLFANNESAREVLNELDIDTLTEAEARAVLEKRVEIRS